MADAGGLGGMIDALGIAANIKTAISLAALAVIAAFLLSRQWLASRRAQIDRAIEKGDDDALAGLLGHVDVPLDTLTPEQKFALGRDQSRQRFWQRMAWQSFLLIGFAGVLLLIFALARPKPEPAVARVPVDAIRMADLLAYVPEAERQAKCVQTLDAATCAGIVQLLAGMARQAPPKVEQQIATSLEQGTVPKGLVLKLDQIKAMRVVNRLTAGDPKGWDVVFRWCTGRMGARNRDNATAAAQALARVPGERIAPGVTLGAIDVAPTANAGLLGGTYIRSDASTGKADAVAAIRSALAGRGFDRYPVRSSTATGKWRIELFDCAFALGEARKS